MVDRGGNYTSPLINLFRVVAESEQIARTISTSNRAMPLLARMVIQSMTVPRLPVIGISLPPTPKQEAHPKTKTRIRIYRKIA